MTTFPQYQKIRCIDINSCLEMKFSPISVENFESRLQSDVLATSWQGSANVVKMLQIYNVTRRLRMSFKHCDNIVSDNILRFLETTFGFLKTV